MNRKIKSWKTTSFDRSIMGNQHCNGRCNHLGSAASFVQNLRLAYNTVDLVPFESSRQASSGMVKNLGIEFAMDHTLES